MLDALIHREKTTSEWIKIPWNDPDFSRRMLKEHLNQMHDAASRRYTIIDDHVAWIHKKILKSQPANILDLGCGPGLYMDRLTKLGHTCNGIDFSPASIEYAKAHHAGKYTLDNVITADFGEGYDLVMMIYGELNAFAPKDAKTILNKAHAALRPGGKLLLEVTRFDVIVGMGGKPATWYTTESGLFSDTPYLCLEEPRFEIDCAITEFYVYVEGAAEATHYAHMHQAYTNDEYRNMLRAFEQVAFYPALTGGSEPEHNFPIVAVKPV